ncbi:chemotaxis protein CheW [Phenylobacterium sp.]|jgi:purine-binding chemotaxis protein CheW|uniref:chemotaxis protein CheW n=1 Tax=Phenylobacterium sp. TaxID=1871053 RepID=UPI003783EC63
MSAPAARYVLFQSSGQELAISAAGVRDVLPTAPLDRPPGSPTALAGFMNVGGRPLAVISLSALFGGAEAGDSLYHHVLRLALADGGPAIGLLVERVTDVDATAHGVAPLDAAQSVNGAVIGNLTVDDRLVPLLDWGRLLLMEERARIEDLAAAVEARLRDLDQAPA